VPLPQPPVKNMTEFVVFCFVSIVALILTLTTVFTLVLQAMNPDRDYSATTGTLTDILTTIIGALIGFIAGKGSGRAEMFDEARERESAALGITKKATAKKAASDVDDDGSA
jgi:hypothetical protein